MLFLRARTALAAAIARPGDRARLLGGAAADARRLAAAGMAWSTGLAALVRAGIAAAEGHVELACARYGEAALQLDAAEMSLYAACARRRQGQVVGASQGEALIAQAETWMRAQGIQDPARMSALMAPGVAD